VTTESDLHNGMGTLEELRGLPQPLLRGVTTHAAKRDGTVIVHVAGGITHIGPGSPESGALSDLAEMLHQALPDVAWHNDVLAACWQKLAANCVINPLSALNECARQTSADTFALIILLLSLNLFVQPGILRDGDALCPRPLQ